MDVDIQPVVGLHLKRGLHARGRKLGLRGIAADCLGHFFADFRKS